MNKDTSADRINVDGNNNTPIEYYEAFGLNTSWPITEVLSKLIEASEILLEKKDYDGHGWEEISYATKRAKELVVFINGWLKKVSTPMPVKDDWKEKRAFDEYFGC